MRIARRVFSLVRLLVGFLSVFVEEVTLLLGQCVLTMEEETVLSLLTGVLDPMVTHLILHLLVDMAEATFVLVITFSVITADHFLCFLQLSSGQLELILQVGIQLHLVCQGLLNIVDILLGTFELPFEVTDLRSEV